MLFILKYLLLGVVIFFAAIGVFINFSDFFVIKSIFFIFGSIFAFTIIFLFFKFIFVDRKRFNNIKVEIPKISPKIYKV